MQIKKVHGVAVLCNCIFDYTFDIYFYSRGAQYKNIPPMDKEVQTQLEGKCQHKQPKPDLAELHTKY